MSPVRRQQSEQVGLTLPFPAPPAHPGRGRWRRRDAAPERGLDMVWAVKNQTGKTVDTFDSQESAQGGADYLNANSTTGNGPFTVEQVG